MATPISAQLSVSATLSGDRILYTLSIFTPSCRKSRGRFEIDFVVAETGGGTVRSTTRGDWTETGRDRFQITGQWHVGGRATRIVSSAARQLSAECD